MAELVTEKIVESLVSKLFELLEKEYGLQKGVRGKIERLSRELRTVGAVLRKIGGVPSDQLDELVRLWVCDIREASYDMEDIVDACLVDHARRPDAPADKTLLERLLKKVVQLFVKSKGRRKISTLIEDINEKLEEVAARRGRYTVDTIVARPVPATTIDPRLLHLYKRAAELVGIEKPRDELINKLSLGHDDHDGGSSDKKMKIVSVVGFGGLGKTTLAKAVYDHFKPHFKCRPSVQLQVDQDPDMNDDKGIGDQLLKPHFECGAFVPVGRNPDIKKVFRDILIDLDKQKYTNSNMNMTAWDEKQLMDELTEFIKEKRFFIVIDDIWNKESWELIRCALQESHYESRLVITTRIFEVATYAGEVYNIQPLSRDNSEKLLYARIADSEGKYFYSPSAEACNKILKKCGGVPLSIITIASLLASRPGEDWSEIYKSIGFGHEGNDKVDNTRKILSFSYYDLPSHLKPCLLYLSIFPEDDVIEKNSLIWKWAAEGFIVIPEEEAAAGVGLFELGERYFNELINRSMIMPKESHDGYIDACSVHDMVLDFIHSLPSNQDVVTVLEGNEQQVPPGTIARRLALRSVRVHDGCQLANIAVEKVRSLIASRCLFYKPWPCLPVLRVLDMVNCVFKYYFFDEGVEENCNKGMLDRPSSLRHLRYLRLELEATYIPELTGEIRYLKFLQTLDLWDFDIDYELPEEVGLLTQLVCLKLRYIIVPTGVISKLTSLQELWIVYVDYELDDAMLPLVKELGLLRELRVLRTEISFGSESTAIALLESLGNLHSIRELQIEGLPRMGYNGETSDAGSVSYRHLRVLRLHCFSGLPAWIKSSLAPNLSYLEVTVQVVKEQDMETLARLPELRCLVLKLELSWRVPLSVISIKIHVGYFRKLRILRIAGMSIWFDLLDSECNSSGSSRASSNNIMPSLESLEFYVDVRSLKAATQFGFHKLIGFDNLGRTSLQSVTATVNCRGARASEAEEVEDALLTAAAAHPKHPTFQARWQEENLISPYQEACTAVSRNPEVVNKAWTKLVNIVSSGYIRALIVPDPAASSSKVIHLLYTNNGIALLALCSNAVHKLWKWKRSDKNPRGKSTTSDPPQLWRPTSGILMKNDTANVNPKESTSCIALSKNNSYVISASGGSASLFNIMTFEVMTTFMEPPPAATFVAFYPQDNNIIACGMEDSSIRIYNVRIDEVKMVLRGHQKRITGLTFSQSKNVLVSSDADAQLCVWSMEDNGWEKKNSAYIQHPANSSERLVGDTTVQFHYDEMHILAVHGTQLVIYDWKLECLCSWSPRDALPAQVTCAVYSSDGFLVYAGFCDGAIGIFEARSLTLQCRIAPSAYIQSPVSSDGGTTVYPMSIAANPLKPNQMAVGMNDGAVYVLEPPLDTDV